MLLHRFYGYVAALAAGNMQIEHNQGNSERLSETL